MLETAPEAVHDGAVFGGAGGGLAGQGQPVTVVTICREPPDVVRRFAAWHRHLGAETVCILFDDPDDPVISEMERFGWLRAIRCDAAFWAALGLAGDAPFALRQVAALTHAYRSVRSGWVAVLDADEAFHFGGRGFAEVLAEVPAQVCGVRVRTAEYMVAGPARPESVGRHLALEDGFAVAMRDVLGQGAVADA